MSDDKVIVDKKLSIYFEENRSIKEEPLDTNEDEHWWSWRNFDMEECKKLKNELKASTDKYRKSEEEVLRQRNLVHICQGYVRSADSKLKQLTDDKVELNETITNLVQALKNNGRELKRLEEENQELRNHLKYDSNMGHRATKRRPSTRLQNEIKSKIKKSTPNLGTIKLVFT